jgi:hypothetical protein
MQNYLCVTLDASNPRFPADREVTRVRWLLWIKSRWALLTAPREQAPPAAGLDLLSIRARVALGCASLEKLCREWQLLSGKMPKLLSALWEFTSAEQLDQWDGRITALVPNDADEIPTFLDQPSLDAERSALIFEMICAVHAIGGENLYCGFVSEYTREPTERALQLLSQAKVSPPNWSPFLRSTVLERGGWGNPQPASFFKS